MCVQILNMAIGLILKTFGTKDNILEQGMDEMVERNAANTAAFAQPIEEDILSEEEKMEEADTNDGNKDLHANSSTHRTVEESSDTDEELILEEENKRKLHAMGTATACAIALHNFPEGLATFVSYVSEPAVGFALATGIAIHNIPEGLCVSMPIYYATGSRWKAFLWGCLSGASEPVGALIGWLVINGSLPGRTYGILFGLVAGIMVYICLDELLPTAYKYNPKGNIVTWTVVIGMFFIALSLVLFSI